jgi:hypothetical protein
VLWRHCCGTVYSCDCIYSGSAWFNAFCDITHKH